MMRLPEFELRRPRTLPEAATILAGEGPDALPLAGGTDLLPNMKRRQQTPRVLVALGGIAGLRTFTNGSGLAIGTGTTLAALAADTRLAQYGALAQAAARVASPQLRNQATLGGNLCLDTRCSYYDQSEPWRQAIGCCLKKDGDTCWVATASRRCVAVSSSDCAPALIALGARVRLVARDGTRDVALEDFYRDDGMDHLVKRPDEILSAVDVPDARGWRSTYWKLRRRGAIDFPVLGVAAAVHCDAGGTTAAARVALGAAGSRPFLVPQAAEELVGRHLDDATIAATARRVAARAKPVDNTDFETRWRKDVAAQLVSYALRELRGEDLGAIRRRF
jgi:4-hydroxybenzoyl-CoA reductase subunit beta